MPSYLKERDGNPGHKQFVTIGERIEEIGEGAARYKDWPEGAWLKKGTKGKVVEYHEGEPAMRVGSQYFPSLAPWAVVEWDFGGRTAISPEDEGRRWRTLE